MVKIFADLATFAHAYSLEFFLKHITCLNTICAADVRNYYLTVYQAVQIFHHFFCCSNTTKVTIVCGHNLTKLGVHPRNINPMPSFLRASFKINSTAPPLGLSFAFIILVLHTSIGEHLFVSQTRKLEVHCSRNKPSHKTCSEMCCKIVPHHSSFQKQLFKFVVTCQLTCRHENATRCICN